MTKSRIAIAVTLLFAAPAAVVAYDQSSSAEAVSVEAVPVSVTEVAPAEMVTISESEITVEPVAVVTEQTVLVPIEAEVIPAQPARIEFSYNSNTFPTGTDDLKLLPRQAAYLERLHQERSSQLSIASAPWNPGSTEPDLHKPLPAQMAYFDRKEQQVFASSDSQSRSPQLAMADTTSPTQ